MKKSSLQAIALVAASLSMTMLGLEVALRIHHGELFHFESLTAERPNEGGRVAYHPVLGWVPKPGRFGGHWTSHVDAAGMRSNGGSLPTSGPPILVIGDSFAFGDEVADDETWAALLESRLNKRVLNAGVGAYGIDQAVLRAELVLDEFQPDVVILSFISDDIARAELAYYPYARAWKPYFELMNDSLRLRNVPVPVTDPPRKLKGLRLALGHSYLANFVLGRIAPQWWKGLPPIMWTHHDGGGVSIALMTRLDSAVKGRGGQFVAVALATNGAIGGNNRLPDVIRRASGRGIRILDLSAETLKLQPDSLQSLFRPGGHYSPAMNAWVAERIATFLRETGIVPGRGI